MLETVRADALARLDSTGSSTTCGAGMRSASSSARPPRRPSSPGLTKRSGTSASSTSSTTCGRRSTGYSVPAASRTRCGAISALERFWRAHAHVGEARRWLALALSLAYDVPADVRAAGLRTAGHQAAAQSDWEAAGTMLEEARDLYHASGQAVEEVRVLAYLSFVALEARRDRASGAGRAGGRGDRGRPRR